MPASAARAAKGEPGSVTTTICRAGDSPAASKAPAIARRWLSVSIVPPLLLLTTATVRDRSPDKAARTWLGSVLSRVTSSAPSTAAITSGASEDPPMPASTTRSRPRARQVASSSASSGRVARERSGASSQPSRIEASACAAGPQAEGSRAASAARIPDSRTDARAESTRPCQSGETPTTTPVMPLMRVLLSTRFRRTPAPA